MENTKYLNRLDEIKNATYNNIYDIITEDYEQDDVWTQERREGEIGPETYFEGPQAYRFIEAQLMHFNGKNGIKYFYAFHELDEGEYFYNLIAGLEHIVDRIDNESNNNVNNPEKDANTKPVSGHSTAYTNVMDSLDTRITRAQGWKELGNQLSFALVALSGNDVTTDERQNALLNIVENSNLQNEPEEIFFRSHQLEDELELLDKQVSINQIKAYIDSFVGFAYRYVAIQNV